MLHLMSLCFSYLTRALTHRDGAYYLGVGTGRLVLVHWLEAFGLFEFLCYVAYELGILGGVELQDLAIWGEVALLKVDIVVAGVGDDVEVVELVAEV